MKKAVGKWIVENVAWVWLATVLAVGFFSGASHKFLWFTIVSVVPLAVGLYVVWSLIWTSLMRRAAASALASTHPVRRLDEHEIEVLTWFGQPERIAYRMPRGHIIDLASAVHPDADPVAHCLSGPYRLQTRQYGLKDKHQFIGPVEVLLLPGAERHLRMHNEAQVLLCDSFAVVISLNGTWHVAQARSLFG